MTYVILSPAPKLRMAKIVKAYKKSIPTLCCKLSFYDENVEACENICLHDQIEENPVFMKMVLEWFKYSLKLSTHPAINPTPFTQSLSSSFFENHT